MANNGFKAKVKPPDPPPITPNPSGIEVPHDPNYDDPRDEYREELTLPYDVATLLATMYDASAPTLVSLEDIIKGNMTISNLDEIDKGMPALLKDIADRVAPLNADFVAKVIPYETVPGIQFELWAIVFIAMVVLFVAVLFVLDLVMNDAVSRVSVTTLIEHSTAQDGLLEKVEKRDWQDGLLAKVEKRDWQESDYSPWALVKEGNTYQVTLRRERIGVRSDETEKPRYD